MNEIKDDNYNIFLYRLDTISQLELKQNYKNSQ